eukprot:334310_1
MHSIEMTSLHKLLLLLVLNQISTVFTDDGSGAFGKWSRESPYGLPFYSYSLDQTTNPAAVSYNNDQTESVSTDTNATNHLLQFGNDRYVIIASNYGFTQMRTDETGPKFLNDYNRKNYQYGGSNGYLIVNNNALSTFYQGNIPSIDITRNYGFYYRNYNIRNNSNKISLNHTVISPFGNDSISISKITISNYNSMDYTNLKYVEVYSNTMYQLTTGTGSVSVTDRRDYQIKNYNVSYSNINYLQNIGLKSTILFKNNKSSNGQWLWDETPPMTFLSTIGFNKTTEIKINHGCELNKFYGKNGAESPAFTVECGNDNNIKYSGLILELSNINIAANSEITLYLMYGYVYNESDIKTYMDKYNDLNLLNNLMEDTACAWSKAAMIFNTNNSKYEWISREILWNYGYLRSSLTFYNLYNEYILDQGTAYRYWDGFQGAFRDPLQHSLPFIYTNPEYVKSILRYSLKEIIGPFNDTTRNYNVPYGLEGNGMIFNITPSTAASDLELYLLFVASEYIISTKDIDFLYEKIDLNIFGENQKYSVLNCLLECYNFFRSHINVGKHGVIRIQTGDWNDAIVWGKGHHEASVKYGESGLNTPLALYILPKFQQVLEMINYKLPADLPQFIENQTNVLQQQLWNGQYINRAWIPSDIDGKTGNWIGSLHDNQMYLFPQVWTILCGENCLSKNDIQIIINNVNKRLRNNATIGAIMLANSSNSLNLGIGSNGGSWYAINHPLVMALSNFNATMAFDEWIRNSFYNRANMYSDFWPGVWSSSDSWSSYLVSSWAANAVGTSLWANYPVFCLHSHAWPLFSFVNGIIGVKFEKNKLIIQPSLHVDFGSFEFKTKLITVKRDEKGNYVGLYQPKQFIGDRFFIEFKLDKLKSYSKSIQITSKQVKSIHWQFYVDNNALFMELK